MWIDEWLFKEGETVTNFAKKLKISRGHLGAVIAGRRRASPELAQHIEKLTKGRVSIRDILFKPVPKRKKTVEEVIS